jgi:hypothetical protein
MKKKNIITLSIFIIFVIALLVFGGYLWLKDQLQQEIIFTNDSKHSINLVEINFSGEELAIKNIQPQSTIRKNITAISDGDFDVKIIFSDDFTIEENNLGYITNGDGSNNIFLVTEERKLIFNQEH